MESTIYQESPLAEYLEGHGEASQSWQTAECEQKPNTPDKASFAPRGPPKPAQSRVQKLLSPLRTQGHRRTRTLTALQDVCTAAMSVQVSASENDRFLDKFRYSIIASQLLDHEINPSNGTQFSIPLGGKEAAQYHAENSYSLQGVAVTTVIAFFAAWILHGARGSSHQSAIHWLNGGNLLVFLVVVAIVMYGYARRKVSQRVRQVAVSALSDLISQSQALSHVARSAVGLVQEVEIVSRGYEISNPLPPISRLEQKGLDRRCLTLRSGVARAISSTIRRYIEAHHAMLPFVDLIDMQRYHDIYDLSRQDYQEVIQDSPATFEDDPESLRGLKASLMRLFIARQVLLCDLLALPSEPSVPDSRRWSVVSDEIAKLSSVVELSANSIGRLIQEEDSRQWGDVAGGLSRDTAESTENGTSEIVVPKTPGKEKVQAQLHRLDTLSKCIRSLNARMLLMRDEANDLIEGAGQSADISSTLAKQYELVGADLRNLMSEWERGRDTMLLGVGPVNRLSLSRSSSGLKTPHSPVPSLGGMTAVNEGSPSEALRRLTGEGAQAPGNDGRTSDEEVFEAISIPSKPKRLSMTREEKLAKMQEDRRKRATLQESRDATTTMLRELETVIKHRPRGRTTSRITSM